MNRMNLIDDHIDHLVMMRRREEEEEENVQRRTRNVTVKFDGRTLTDFMFLRHYRFSKGGFERLLGRIGHLLAHEDGRGGPISPDIQLQAALNHMAGALFQRSTGLTCGASQTECWKAMPGPGGWCFDHTEGRVCLHAVNQ